MSRIFFPMSLKAHPPVDLDRIHTSHEETAAVMNKKVSWSCRLICCKQNKTHNSQVMLLARFLLCAEFMSPARQSLECTFIMVIDTDKTWCDLQSQAMLKGAPVRV